MLLRRSYADFSSNLYKIIQMNCVILFVRNLLKTTEILLCPRVYDLTLELLMQNIKNPLPIVICFYTFNMCRPLVCLKERKRRYPLFMLLRPSSADIFQVEVSKSK